MRRDPVTPQVYDLVMRRDYGCVAPRLDPDAGPCSGMGGSLMLELDHVHDEPTAGRRAPSDPAHLVVLCAFHHRGSKAGHVWATANRPLLRAYLKEMS